MEHLDTSTGATRGQVTPGYTMNINAFVYAQTGSWFVIPNALFNPKDYTSDAAGANTIFGTNAPDTNRNGVSDLGEVDARLRYSRANYQVNFKGAIAENQTAIVNPIINTTDPTKSVTGAVQAWSNDWANYTEKAGTISNPLPGVTYTFDPSYANNPAGLDDGFVMPQSDQLTYVE